MTRGKLAALDDGPLVQSLGAPLPVTRTSKETEKLGPLCELVLTATDAQPGLVMSVAKIDAVIWFALTNVVGFVAPFQVTTYPLAKFDPFTVRVNAAPPDAIVAGETEVSTGSPVFGARMKKVANADCPPDGSGLMT